MIRKSVIIVIENLGILRKTIKNLNGLKYSALFIEVVK